MMYRDLITSFCDVLQPDFSKSLLYCSVQHRTREIKQLYRYQFSVDHQHASSAYIIQHI